MSIVKELEGLLIELDDCHARLRKVINEAIARQSNDSTEVETDYCNCEDPVPMLTGSNKVKCARCLCLIDQDKPE